MCPCKITQFLWKLQYALLWNFACQITHNGNKSLPGTNFPNGSGNLTDGLYVDTCLQGMAANQGVLLQGHVIENIQGQEVSPISPYQ